MAEGVLGGIGGGADAKPELEASASPASAAAFAAAIAHHASIHNPDVARDAAAFLRGQLRHVQVQTEHLEEEHTLRLFGLRMRIAWQLFIALVATVIGGVGAILLHDAITSRGVVIEPFEVPASLAPRGVTGTVVATGILDELRRMQIETRTSAAAGEKRNLSSAWSHDVKVAIPESGISLGEVSSMLKERFGHDLHIAGDLVEDRAGGLALTVRGDGVPPKSFAGTADELDKITVAAASYVYSTSQPTLWSIYLENEFRCDEAIAFIKSMYAGASATDRPYLLNSWANCLNLGTNDASAADSLPLYRAAVALKPDYWVAYSNITGALLALGDEEDAWRNAGALAKAAGGRPGAALESYYSAYDLLTMNLQTGLAAALADAENSAGYGTADFTAGPQIAQIHALMHDPAAAELTLKTIVPNPRDPSIGAGVHLVRGMLALEAGDSAVALTEMEAFDALFGNRMVKAGYSQDRCSAALAAEGAGRHDRADAILAGGGRFVDCYRFRGDILDGRGDWPGAQKAYTQAVALAPDIPAAYYSWGAALARHSDVAGAEAKFKEANQRAPRWADPLKAWGDVLVRKGQKVAALAKYDEALKYAPQWAALTKARAQTAQHAN